MSESQSNPFNEVSATNAAESNPKPQQNILDGQSSFTELKESCQIQAEYQQFKQLEQCMNQQGATSREDLISIKTFNGHATQLRSAETLFMEEEKDAEKMDHCEHVQIKGDKSEDSSNKESVKMDNIEQQIKKVCAPLDGISLTQTTPFQVLQEKNIDRVKPISPNNEDCERTFTFAHTQQITIDHGICKINQQKLDQVTEALNNALLQRKSKLSIAKTLEQNHTPCQSQNKQEQMKNAQEHVPQVSKEEAKVQTSEIKQENVPKPQPFKLQNLYVSSLRSSSVIKPPQSTSEKKPKIWQMFKSKRQSKEPAPANPPKQEQIVNSVTQNALQKPLLNTDAANNNNAISQDVIKANLPVQRLKESASQPVKQPLKLDQTKQTLQNIPQAAKIEQKTHHKPLFDDRDEQIEPDIIQFHQTKHNPLERPSIQQKEKPQLESKISVQPQQQTNLTSIIDNTTELKQQQQQQKQINLQNQKGQKQQEKQIKMESQQSQASASQRQEMLVDYTHNKDYQLQLQKMNRQKIKQLEQKLRNQEQLNRQLQKSLSFPTKLLTSAAIGASTAGIAWVVKKNRNLSILLGFATTLASFVLSD